MILSSSSTLPLGRRGSQPRVSQAASNQSRAVFAACGEGSTSTDRSTVRRASKMTVTSLRMGRLRKCAETRCRQYAAKAAPQTVGPATLPPAAVLPALGSFPGDVGAFGQRAAHHVEQGKGPLVQLHGLGHG